MGETEEDLPVLERLLRCSHEASHVAIADALWEAASDQDAVAALERLARADGALAGWEAELRAGRGEASGGSGAGGRDGGKKGRGGRGGGRGDGSSRDGSSSGDDAQG